LPKILAGQGFFGFFHFGVSLIGVCRPGNKHCKAGAFETQSKSRWNSSSQKSVSVIKLVSLCREKFH